MKYIPFQLLLKYKFTLQRRHFVQKGALRNSYCQSQGTSIHNLKFIFKEPNWNKIMISNFKLNNPGGSYSRLNKCCREGKFWYQGQFSYLCYNLRTTHSKLKHCIVCLPIHSFSTLFLYLFFGTKPVFNTLLRDWS